MAKGLYRSVIRFLFLSDKICEKINLILDGVYETHSSPGGPKTQLDVLAIACLCFKYLDELVSKTARPPQFGGVI